MSSEDSESWDSQRDAQSRVGSIRRERFHSLRCVKQVSGKTKDHRSEKCKSKVLISEVPTLQKFEDRFHEETARQERCVQSKARNLANNIYKLKANDRATFFSSAKWVLQVPQQESQRKREFVVDSGASMHMISEKDLNFTELEIMRTSRSPTPVMTVNDEVQTREEVTENIK